MDGVKNRKQRLTEGSKLFASMGSSARNGKSEVSPPGWQIAPGKR